MATVIYSTDLGRLVIPHYLRMRPCKPQVGKYKQNLRVVPSQHNGMFDVDCSNIGIKCVPKPGSVPCVEPYPSVDAKTKGLDKIDNVITVNPVHTHKNKVCETLVAQIPYDNNPKQAAGVQLPQKGARVYTTQGQTTLNFLLKRETLASMYIASMFIGFAMLGIVGGAINQLHVFLSFSLFYGFFIPVVILHGTSLVHRMWSVLPMLVYLIYAPVSVSLSIIHKSHVFLSASLVMIGICFVIASAAGWTRLISIVVLTLFTLMCFGGALNSPDRGDVMALVVIPAIQIFYVCLAGAASVLTIPIQIGFNSTKHIHMPNYVYHDTVVQLS
jgi:hypothetical protein